MANYKSLDGARQSVLWTVYHTILAVELGLIVLIESAEFVLYYNQLYGY